MKNALHTLLLSLVLAAALMAQGMGGPNNPQNYVKRMTAELGLTADQQSQAATIFTNSTASQAPVHSSMATARQTLENAIRNNDTNTIEQVATTIGNLTAQLTLAQSKARAAFYQILTPDQQTKLNQLESQRPNFRGGARPASRPNGQ
jgi:Spy/CpxP family protein refolding chaperone